LSSTLTVGTPDANGAGANSNGQVSLGVVAGNPATTEDEADVKLEVTLGDVRNASDLSDYTGELDVRANLRMTDRRNGPDETESGTVGDFDLEIPVPCAGTDAPGTGASCRASTTADAITPGMVVESARSVWELGRVVVHDGGADGIASTPGNEPFEVQGVFVP
jgi:hypothetical protein